MEQKISLKKKENLGAALEREGVRKKEKVQFCNMQVKI